MSHSSAVIEVSGNHSSKCRRISSAGVCDWDMQVTYCCIGLDHEFHRIPYQVRVILRVILVKPLKWNMHCKSPRSVTNPIENDLNVLEAWKLSETEVLPQNEREDGRKDLLS